MYSELLKKKGLFKEQNADFSAQIHSVTLTKTCLFKIGMLSYSTPSLLKEVI